MKEFTRSLSTKLWLTITTAVLVTIVYSYLLSNLFYEKLYVENIEASLQEEGNRLALDYSGGPLTDELKEKINWYNTKTETDVFIVSNPRELSACLPFDIDHEALIGPEEREQLLKGEAIQKTGFEERFDRKIVAVIIPLVDENRLEGIIYLYIPLAKISELTKDFSILWLLFAMVFLVFALFFGSKLVNRLTKPLKDMKSAAIRVSKGDYTARVKRQTNDEVGQLADAFNHMATSIQKEDERKKEFLANVSHELRTPISYVKGYSEALMKNIVKTEEDQAKYLQLMYRESGRMERLVGDLLDLTKLDTDEYKLIKMPLSLAQLIEDAVQKYLPVMKERELDFSYDLDPDIIIEADEGRIEQVIQNIMDNALRYINKGGIHIELVQKHDTCMLKIMDTGIGIPKEDLSQIKHRFYRVNKARTRTDGGTGLGLAIIDKIIELHGGDLSFESEVGKGTTVIIVLPMLLRYD
ncbi:HAMP domain-containing histidine kinase [Cytobacillus spongiae]|jgi:signal transduction histidine kinase|uniref:sensor histidine kinase n=1 Tax=Cytobacillus spongiae TaxID=2901381 RepID=UPI001F2EAD90|nr:HAMP domain-containing sensor histidine kinase [Cytobacillus spongiae]UII54449.1 HAMP domain-containing histidine kinase [Cytobacillus spongiae]